MSGPDAFQVSLEAAEVYERVFVPAVFGRWAPSLIDAAGVAPGQTVVDVACGTGVVARQVADRLSGQGRVIGVDLNDGMLAVARRLRPDIEWHRADATTLPLPAGSADVVLCQAALMFFPEPVQALREMARVVSPTGTVGVQVWGDVDSQVGWAPFYSVVRRHAGADAVNLIASYWRLGDLDELTALYATSGLSIEQVLTREDTATFTSVEDFVATEIDGTPLHEQIPASVRSRIVDDVRTAMQSFLAADGQLVLPICGHIVTARRAFAPDDR